MTYQAILEATGCPYKKEDFLKESRTADIREYGAAQENTPEENTRAVNEAIQHMSATGGTVIIPPGEFLVYTLRLLSHVNLWLQKGSILRAAKTEIRDFYQEQESEGGNYEEPEINLYAGIQDHGHTYLANSLIYGKGIEDVMIYGEGLIDGSRINQQGEMEFVLLGGDPDWPLKRSERGHRGRWFGNKAIAFDDCKKMALCDISIVAGGHFAVLATCVTDMLIDRILIDTNRDALDVDCCQNVTITNSTFNSLTDDAVVLKASFGGGRYMPLKNVLVEDCMVCGFDCGSVYRGTFTQDKLIATDRCGPTGRVKLGTESTCGYECVTVRRVHFKRSRGFALEAVDGSDLSHIIFEDSFMEDVSSSPIYIRTGDRGRFPVTGNSRMEHFPVPDKEKSNVRLDHTEWILPSDNEYTRYPAKRYLPSYRYTKNIQRMGSLPFFIVDQNEPCQINQANYYQEGDTYYEMKFDQDKAEYVPDKNKTIRASDLVLYANASGSSEIASVHDIRIRNITVKNADPRYPIEIMGLMGSPVRNIWIENINVEYRGGLNLKEACLQRQVNTNWSYDAGGTKKSVQTLPWLINTFFVKHEALLPRMVWNKTSSEWEQEPFLVPEVPDVYPEPSNFGILPAYGLYARHVENLCLDNITLTYQTEDTRYPVVLDDITGGHLTGCNAMHTAQKQEVVLVKQHFKRPAGFEYVQGYPYSSTSVSDFIIDKEISYCVKEIEAPSPGTPSDWLYPYPTAATEENGYKEEEPVTDTSLLQTVYRPFFHPVAEQRVKAGECMSFYITARQPAYEATQQEAESKIYNETVNSSELLVKGIASPMALLCMEKPQNAVCKTDNFAPGVPVLFQWETTAADAGTKPHRLMLTADDKITQIHMSVDLYVDTV